MDARWKPKSAVALERTDAEATSPETIANFRSKEEPEIVHFLTAPYFLADPAQSHNVAENAVRSPSPAGRHHHPIAPGRDVRGYFAPWPAVRPGKIAEENSSGCKRVVDASE